MVAEVIIISGTFAPPFGIRQYPYFALTNFFESRGHKVHVEGIRLLGLGRIEKSLEKIEERYFKGNDKRYILVGHSQGGLLALSLAAEYADRVDAVEILGAPLYGTRIAPVWLPLPPAEIMNYRSRWLKQLRDHQSLNVHKVHSYFSAVDILVVPWFASVVKDGNNHLLVPSQLQSPASLVGKIFLGERIKTVEVIHGLGGHIKIVSHPAVLSSLAKRYRPLPSPILKSPA